MIVLNWEVATTRRRPAPTHGEQYGSVFIQETRHYPAVGAPIAKPTLRERLCMAQYYWDAEERRRVSMELSMRHETAAKFAKLRRKIWTMLVNVFHVSAS